MRKGKNHNIPKGKKKKAAGQKTEQKELEVLADLICKELSDDAKMLYSSRNGILRELKNNVNMLESVLSGRDRKRVTGSFY